MTIFIMGKFVNSLGFRVILQWAHNLCLRLTSCIKVGKFLSLYFLSNKIGTVGSWVLYKIFYAKHIVLCLVHSEHSTDFFFFFIISLYFIFITTTCTVLLKVRKIWVWILAGRIWSIFLSLFICKMELTVINLPYLIGMWQLNWIIYVTCLTHYLTQANSCMEISYYGSLIIIISTINKVDVTLKCNNVYKAQVQCLNLNKH